MPISDADFDGQLDDLAESTVGVVTRTRADEFSPTVFLVYEDRISIEGLLNEGEDDRNVELYDLLFGFGKELAKHDKLPLAVYVAAQFLWPPDDAPCIFLSGCTPDGRKNGAAMMWTEEEDGTMRITNTLYLRQANKVEFRGRTGAGEVIRGFMDAVAAKP